MCKGSFMCSHVEEQISRSYSPSDQEENANPYAIQSSPTEGPMEKGREDQTSSCDTYQQCSHGSQETSISPPFQELHRSYPLSPLPTLCSPRLRVVRTLTELTETLPLLSPVAFSFQRNARLIGYRPTRKATTASPAGMEIILSNRCMASIPLLVLPGIPSST